MTDQQFLEIITIENLQREDVHPLEEASGYQSLLQLKDYDVQKIADRVGRSVKYVYDRVKLLQLTKEAQKLFFDDRITAGHAILLARLSGADQKRVMEESLWEDEKLPFHPEDDRGGRIDDAQKPISVRELQDISLERGFRRRGSCATSLSHM